MFYLSTPLAGIAAIDGASIRLPEWNLGLWRARVSRSSAGAVSLALARLGAKKPVPRLASAACYA
jgi:hypothetical protein